LNARNLEALNAVPAGRVSVQGPPDFSSQITLDPLNQLPIGNHGDLVVRIPANATSPHRTNGSSYTVEFRRKAGWDRSIPEDAVLIHEVRSNGLSYLQPAIWGRFTSGQQFVTPDPKVFIQVVSIDSTPGTARLHVWDIPEGSLRKEASKPKVFLIEGGQKRWITSPQVLFALGRTWDDVRVVPDGGLSSLLDGPNIDLPVTPLPERAWLLIGHANDVVAMTAANGKLFAATGNSKLWWRDPVGQDVDWEHVGHANSVVAMTATSGKLFAATSDNKLWWRDPVGQDVDWEHIGHANNVVAMAAINGKLFAATSDNKLWWRDPAH
jgi:hypothetical protein